MFSHKYDTKSGNKLYKYQIVDTLKQGSTNYGPQSDEVYNQILIPSPPKGQYKKSKICVISENHYLVMFYNHYELNNYI